MYWIPAYAGNDNQRLIFNFEIGSNQTMTALERSLRVYASRDFFVSFIVFIW